MSLIVFVFLLKPYFHPLTKLLSIDLLINAEEKSTFSVLANFFCNKFEGTWT